MTTNIRVGFWPRTLVAFNGLVVVLRYHNGAVVTGQLTEIGETSATVIADDGTRRLVDYNDLFECTQA